VDTWATDQRCSACRPKAGKPEHVHAQIPQSHEHRLHSLRAVVTGAHDHHHVERVIEHVQRLRHLRDDEHLPAAAQLTCGVDVDRPVGREGLEEVERLVVLVRLVGGRHDVEHLPVGRPLRREPVGHLDVTLRARDVHRHLLDGPVELRLLDRL
jgi:hypothetical protein